MLGLLVATVVIATVLFLLGAQHFIFSSSHLKLSVISAFKKHVKLIIGLMHCPGQYSVAMVSGGGVVVVVVVAIVVWGRSTG
jgi:hypothetical protein